MIDLQDPAFYADWSEEDLKNHIAKLREILGKKQGIEPLPPKERILQMFDPHGEDFLGTGMTLTEWVAANRIQEIRSNIIFQTSTERRRRMDLLIEMSAELAKIKGQTRFATSLARGVIEDVIKGDWNGLRIMAEYFTFKDEDADLRNHEGPIYARFAELCRKGFEDRPGAEEVAEAPKN